MEPATNALLDGVGRPLTEMAATLTGKQGPLLSQLPTQLSRELLGLHANLPGDEPLHESPD